MPLSNEQKNKIREEYLKYYAFVMSSGIHGVELQKVLSDFWLSKFDSLQVEIKEELVKEMQFNAQLFANRMVVEAKEELRKEIKKLKIGGTSPFSVGYDKALDDLLQTLN